MDRPALAAWLYDHRHEAQVIGTLADSEGWSPAEGRCHDNAAAWVAAHPGYRRTPGWIPAPTEGPYNGCRFHSHSVVEDDAGRLWDVTLSSARLQTFIRHPWPQADFYEAVKDQRMPSLDHAYGPQVDVLSIGRAQEPEDPFSGGGLW